MNLGNLLYHTNNHSITLSVDASREKEVLYQGNDLDLAQINEELLELILCGAVQDEIGSENEDGGGEDRQYLKALEAEDSVPEKINLKEG